MTTRHYSILFTGILMLIANVTGISAQTIEKKFLFRSKEKITVSDWERFGNEYHAVEKSKYEEIFLTIVLDYSVEAYAYRDNQYLQKDIIKHLADTNRYSSSFKVAFANQIRNEKTIDDVFKKINTIEGYDVFIEENNPSQFLEECQRYPDSKKAAPEIGSTIIVENGMLVAREVTFKSYKNAISFYDIETGKRIELSDVFKSLQYIRRSYEDKLDTFKITNITLIEKDRLSFDCVRINDDHKSFSSYSADAPELTEYAKALMARDKDKKVITRENEFGDQIRTFSFKNINNTNQNKNVAIPIYIKGCKDIKKIQHKMLDVMFGHSNGNLDTLVENGVKRWINDDYSRGPNMLLGYGEGLISFGFEDISRHNNIANTFMVFNKETGEEIKVDNLIKDKKGFMAFVNSHNLYMAGYIFDSTKKEETHKKLGSDFRNYVKHSGGYFGDFKGLSEFPNSWWFSLGKVDGMIPIEFNTPTQRIFVDYCDIRKYINPKYQKIIDTTVNYINSHSKK